MKKSPLIPLKVPITVNYILITGVIIGQHYKEKHAESINDELVIQLVLSLDEKSFEADSSSRGIEYYVSDIQLKNDNHKIKNYRLIWIFEGHRLEIIGVINAFRVKRTKK
jgi:hypothetical protein